MKINKDAMREPNPENIFERKKRAYFSRLASGVLSAMRLHKTPGMLWERREGKRDWGNISWHCLVVLARVRVFARKLELPAEDRRDLELAAALHDFYKRNEILAMKAAIARGESGAQASDDSDSEGELQLRAAGFSGNVVEIACLTGGKYQELAAMADILEKSELTAKDLARLVLHYVDGYTRNAEWVEPAARADGGTINEVDRRTQKNLENPNYRKQNEESVGEFASHPLLKGRGGIENLGLICHMIEKQLAGLIAEKTGENIAPLELPEAVDREIKKEIEEEIV